MPTRKFRTSIGLDPKLKERFGAIIIEIAGHDNFYSWDEAIEFVIDKLKVRSEDQKSYTVVPERPQDSLQEEQKSD